MSHKACDESQTGYTTKIADTIKRGVIATGKNLTI
jgi:hypothetical protein